MGDKTTRQDKIRDKTRQHGRQNKWETRQDERQDKMEDMTSVGCIYASYPRYKSNILQNLFKSFKLLSKHSKYSKTFS